MLVSEGLDLLIDTLVMVYVINLNHGSPIIGPLIYPLNLYYY